MRLLRLCLLILALRLFLSDPIMIYVFVSFFSFWEIFPQQGRFRTHPAISWRGSYKTTF